VILLKGTKLLDESKLSLNLAKLKKGGEKFIVVVDPDLAIKYTQGVDVNLREVLMTEDIFSDPQKGEHVSEKRMEEVFGTKDPLKVAEHILKEGEIQLTSEYRAEVREKKKKKIIEIIHRNAVDPKTGLPHPVSRIENAFEEAKIHIDERKKAEDQISDIIKKLMPILAIRFELKEIELHIPASYAGKLYGLVASFGKILRDEWLNDGSWKCVVEIPAGLQTELYDSLNNRTHGSVDARVLKTK
jgi:ribosome maturation protein SDO1